MSNPKLSLNPIYEKHNKFSTVITCVAYQHPLLIVGLQIPTLLIWNRQQNQTEPMICSLYGLFPSGAETISIKYVFVDPTADHIFASLSNGQLCYVSTDSLRNPNLLTKFRVSHVSCMAFPGTGTTKTTCHSILFGVRQGRVISASVEYGKDRNVRSISQIPSTAKLFQISHFFTSSFLEKNSTEKVTKTDATILVSTVDGVYYINSPLNFTEVAKSSPLTANILVKFPHVLDLEVLSAHFVAQQNIFYVLRQKEIFRTKLKVSNSSSFETQQTRPFSSPFSKMSALSHIGLTVDDKDLEVPIFKLDSDNKQEDASLLQFHFLDGWLYCLTSEPSIHLINSLNCTKLETICLPPTQKPIYLFIRDYEISLFTNNHCYSVVPTSPIKEPYLPFLWAEQFDQALKKCKSEDEEQIVITSHAEFLLKYKKFISAAEKFAHVQKKPIEEISLKLLECPTKLPLIVYLMLTLEKISPNKSMCMEMETATPGPSEAMISLWLLDLLANFDLKEDLVYDEDEAATEKQFKYIELSTPLLLRRISKHVELLPLATSITMNSGRFDMFEDLATFNSDAKSFVISRCLRGEFESSIDLLLSNSKHNSVPELVEMYSHEFFRFFPAKFFKIAKALCFCIPDLDLIFSSAIADTYLLKTDTCETCKELYEFHEAFSSDPSNQVLQSKILTRLSHEKTEGNKTCFVQRKKYAIALCKEVLRYVSQEKIPNHNFRIRETSENNCNISPETTGNLWTDLLVRFLHSDFGRHSQIFEESQFMELLASAPEYCDYEYLEREALMSDRLNCARKIAIHFKHLELSLVLSSQSKENSSISDLLLLLEDVPKETRKLLRPSLLLLLESHKSEPQILAKILKASKGALNVQDLLMLLSSDESLNSFGDLILDSLDQHEKSSAAVSEEVSKVGKQLEDLTKALQNVKQKHVFLDSDALCDVCGLKLFDPKFSSEKIFAFRCGHSVHFSCCKNTIWKFMGEEEKREMKHLFLEIENNGTTNDKLNSLLAKNCLICGEAMIRSVFEPFATQGHSLYDQFAF
eukprot:GHVP01043264.1.p1 GENE.GHVP01043264.1~~GHVP01043264.1.p1  ORF type:complete len:1037 (+),score=178.64 GHVP01043264.1:25-3135(+)